MQADKNLINGLPASAWTRIFYFLELPDLVQLGLALPGVCPLLDKALNWRHILLEEFVLDRGMKVERLSFKYFLTHWRKLYSLDTMSKVPGMHRTEVRKPVAKLTECLIQTTDGALLFSGKLTDTENIDISGAIQGGGGTAWKGQYLWYRDDKFKLRHVIFNKQFDIQCATVAGKDIYAYSPSLGIFQVVNIAKKYIIDKAMHAVKDIRVVCKPHVPVKSLVSTRDGTLYLSSEGSVYDLNNTCLAKGSYTQLAAWRRGFLALDYDGSIYDSNHSQTCKYPERITSICVSLDLALVLGASGFLYMLSNTQGLPIKSIVEIPGRVEEICTGFFRKDVYAIVSQTGPGVGKPSVKSRFKAGWLNAKSKVPQDYVATGLFM